MLQNTTDGMNRLQTLTGSYHNTAAPANIFTRPPIRGYPLHRYYKRSIVLIVAPIAVTVYYIWIWRVFLTRDTNGLKYSQLKELWIFYSWFVIGVFGLNLSKYGLVGIEAAMLHEPFWQVDNTMVLLMHSGSTWSGPTGWMKCIKMLLRRKRITQRLWFALAFISILPFAAMPLSGLTMELADGYIKTQDHPEVLGRNLENFWDRPDKNNNAAQWLSGMVPKVPGLGIAYTPPYIRRDQWSFLKDLPNAFPDAKEPNEAGIAEIFLGPQASVPVAGEAWGLLFGMNCSVVETESELTILNKKHARHVGYIGDPSPPDGSTIDYYSTTVPEDSEDIITVFNSSRLSTPENLWAYAEIGISDSSKLMLKPGHSSPLNQERGPKQDILEYVLWQVQIAPLYDAGGEFDDTVDTPITGLGHILEENNGTFSVNKTLRPSWSPATSFANVDNLGNAQTTEGGALNIVSTGIRSLSPPIGVRCVRKSAFGKADIDGQTFTSFNREPFNETSFGDAAANILLAPLTNLLKSTNAPAPTRDGILAHYPNFVQAKTLLRAVLRAHAVDALQLMYDGIDNFDAAYKSLDLTSSEAGKVLERGVVPPVVVATLFLIWAITCIFLGCTYGFRRRWADTLDGYTFLRFGADFSSDICGKAEFSCVKSFDRCETLRRLPGLVGDSQVKMDIGHITIVRSGNVARKDKLYI